MSADDESWAALTRTLTVAQTANILNVKPPAVFARLQAGAIPAHQVAGSWIIFTAEVREWLITTSDQPSPAVPHPPADVLADFPYELDYRDLMVL